MRGFDRNALFVSSAIVCAAASAPAMAQTKSFDVPAQAAHSAIAQLGRQADIQIIAARKITRGKVANAVRGSLTVEQALTALLRGTGLTARLTGPQTYTVVQAQVTSDATLSSPQSEPVRIAASASAEGEPLAGEIIVTARKKAEKLFEVPQSISALDSDSLQKLGATQFRDFAAIVPGMSFGTQGAGYTQITLRGVTAGVDITPTVGVYVDDIPYGYSAGGTDSARRTLDVGLFDLDRVEVLRGPQGTLYGAGAMGGILKYVTKMPDLQKLGGEARLGIADTEQGGTSYTIAAAVSSPIVADKLAVRASGYFFRDGGYIDNLALGEKDVNRSRIYGGRLDLLAKPTENLSIRLVGFLQDIYRRGEATADYRYDGSPVDGALDQRRLVPEEFDQQFRLASASITYEGDGFSIASLSGYQTSRGVFTLDVTPLYRTLLQTRFGRSYSAIGTVQYSDVDKFTQEIRANGTTGALDWVVGGFYTKEKADRIVMLEPLLDAAGNRVANDLLTTDRPSSFKEYAGFANLTWRFTDRFDISGGLRVARNRQDFRQTGSGLLGASRPLRASSETVKTYLANARYRFDADSMVYARFATGYRPGGPNFVGGALAGTSAETYDSDRLKSYEIGFRTRTMDKRFSLDFSAYQIDWDAIQINTVSGGFAVIANGPDARIRGAELSVTLRPLDGLTMVGALAYQDAELRDADASLGASRGDRLPNVPKFTAALQADYVMGSSDLAPTLGTTIRYVSDRDASFDRSTGYLQFALPAYTVVDLRAGVTLDPVTVRLSVKNLLDSRGKLSALNWRGPAMPAIVQPRTIGLDLITTF